MTALSKRPAELIETRPATPGSPGYPGQPYIPERCAEETSTQYMWVWVPYDESEIDFPSGYEEQGGYWVWAAVEVTAVVCYPAQEYIPPSAPTPPTPAEIIEKLYIGWDSHSRAIESLAVGEFIDFNLNTGVAGAFIGVGIHGKDSAHMAAFTHGVIVDVTGISVYEEGVEKTSMETVQLAASRIRIYRDSASNILYHVVKSDGTSITVESALPVINKLAPLYVYAKLYMSGDSVPEADFLTGEVQFIEA